MKIFNIIHISVFSIILYLCCISATVARSENYSNCLHFTEKVMSLTEIDLNDILFGDTLTTSFKMVTSKKQAIMQAKKAGWNPAPECENSIIYHDATGAVDYIDFIP